ncbi:guanylate-binding protein 3-like [Phalaenopsis equestris]|uniref:guanylate-binding protein 3-like n=1 Tax=Phalaenopsis equestris TaxID=78828 RepID=UPI0009E3608E|nr:guanylate-binding protein 3-like [Phalaenopsis equestris]
MMERLRFRGGSAPKEKEVPPRSDKGSPSGNSGSESVGVGPARPLRLVYCDEKGKFVMDPEAVATLQLVKGPIGVVSVCGRARQGKSFILNQLLGRSSGFQVSSTHRPCTKGLWMWSAPLKKTALDGTEYNLLLLDSEGIDAYDQTGTYSIQIFSLAVLLSSMFIYNQMGGIDEAALDRLSLVTQMTKHIRVRASGRTTTSELGQFSPVFIWLLRDFYLDLVEDNRRITPRDYLEQALRHVQGGGKDISAKNEIRESIRGLFPDRECFTLVRPLNNESDLQRLDQIPLDRLRPEFRSSLDALTEFIFERTRPKQIGASVMTGPILAGITQSFLDAINKGAVPTISSSWQSVEETECRRAYDAATEMYTSSFDRTIPAEEDILREAHEVAMQKALNVFNSNAVGVGSARLNYEKLLNNFFKKTFEEYKRSAFLAADLQCSRLIKTMEEKLRAACHVPNANVDDVVSVLDRLVNDYESSTHGSGKSEMLASFILKSLKGPMLELHNKQLYEIKSEMNALKLRCNSNDDKLELLKKQLEANEKHRADYLKRYEDAVNDKKRFADDYSVNIANWKSKCSTLEERCSSITKSLELAKSESAEWKIKYEHILSEQKAVEEKLKFQAAALESRNSATEGRLAALREQSNAAQEEAKEWKRKYEFSLGEAKTARDRAALTLEQSNKKAQQREDALRTELSSKIAKKDEEIRKLAAKIDHTEMHASSLVSQLEIVESGLKSHELENSALKKEVKALTEKLDSFKSSSHSQEKELKILEQEKNHLQEKYLSECKKSDAAQNRCNNAEREAKNAMEVADTARAEAAAAQKEKSESQHMAMERLTLIERMQRQIEGLEREKSKLMEDVKRVHSSEIEAVLKADLLERRLQERDEEMEAMLSKNNEQRSSTVQVLESLLATERAANAEANNRAKALSVQLSKLDVLQQELTTIRLNESTHDSKLRAAHGRRSRTEYQPATESVHDLEFDGEINRKEKRSKSTTSPLKLNLTEDGGSVYRGDDDQNQSQVLQDNDTEDYTKFTVVTLKQELTKHGFGAELLQLKNPNKKDILALYSKHVLKK